MPIGWAMPLLSTVVTWRLASSIRVGFRIGGGMANGQQVDAGRCQQILCGIPHLS